MSAKLFKVEKKFGENFMKIRIRKVIKESMDMSEAKELLKNNWAQGWFLAASLEGDEPQMLMMAALEAFKESMLKLEKEMDYYLTRMRRGYIFKVTFDDIKADDHQVKWPIKATVSKYDAVWQDRFDESYATLNDDGSIDLDLYMKPNQSFIERLKPQKRYQQSEDDLADAVELISELYKERKV
jgi:hypothetical protein